jgi:hypothetical protein
MELTAADARQSVDAYYADILDIPAHRDSGTDNYASTRRQILRLQSPMPRVIGDPNLYTDAFFNNSPYVQDYEESGAPRFEAGTFWATDTQRSSDVHRGRVFWISGLARCEPCRIRR